jgi:hypothetical protein
MKPNQMRAYLRLATTDRQLKALEVEFTSEWAGSHKGRRRCVAMLKAKRKRFEARR